MKQKPKQKQTKNQNTTQKNLQTKTRKSQPNEKSHLTWVWLGNIKLGVWMQTLQVGTFLSR